MFFAQGDFSKEEIGHESDDYYYQTNEEDFCQGGIESLLQCLQYLVEEYFPLRSQLVEHGLQLILCLSTEQYLRVVDEGT